MSVTAYETDNNIRLNSAMEDKKTSKIQRMAEVLPNNAATIKILKDREDIAQAKAEREKAVSNYAIIIQN